MNIGSAAFSNKLAITSVAIPNNTTNLGTNSFYLCTGLTNISFGTGLLSINHGAFYGCKQLASVTIPNTVRSLGSNVFNQCVGLTNVGIGSVVTNLGTSVFQACSNLASVAIPNSVTNIEAYSFKSCVSLASIALGGNVRAIGNSAFQDCSALSMITIPNSVKYIGSYAFSSCASLTNSTLETGVVNIGYDAFSSCSNLASIIVPDSTTNLAWGVFAACTKLQTAVIGNHVPTLSGTFINCWGLTNVTIGTNVTNIDIAFSDCYSLTSVFLPASVTNIGFPAFRDCTSLLAINVASANPAYVSVDGVLFDKAQKKLLRFPVGRGGSYTIPDSVTSFAYAFWDNSSLTNVMIGSGVTNVGYAPFDPGTSLENIDVSPLNPAYLSLNGVLFDKSRTTLLRFPPARSTSYVIAAGVTTLAEEAFDFSAILNSVTIPASTTNLQSSVFAFCPNLLAVTFLGNAPNYVDDVTLFFGDTNTTVYYLPGTTGWNSTFGGRLSVLWNPQATALNHTNGHFGFNITGPTNAVIVVEACTNFVNPIWLPVSTNTLTTGVSSFSDSQSSNYPSRFYRFRSP